MKQRALFQNDVNSLKKVQKSGRQREENGTGLIEAQYLRRLENDFAII